MAGGRRGSTISYDFASNLLQQRDTGPGLDLIQNFALDHLTNIAYQSSSNGDRFSVLTGRTIDQHLAVIRPGGLVEYQLSDAINSTIATVDDGGTIRSRFFYEPFGQTNSTGRHYPFQYTGRVLVSSDLYYYRARYYSPLKGRFISEDPLGFSGQELNRYRYVLNNPILFVDSDGNQAQRPEGECTLTRIICPDPNQPYITCYPIREGYRFGRDQYGNDRFAYACTYDCPGRGQVTVIGACRRFIRVPLVGPLDDDCSGIPPSQRLR